MKGLILKDLYTIKAYFRSFIFLFLIFIVSSCFGRSSFFLFYPCILSGMIAMSLIAYEEREKWDVFAQTLPCGRSQIVSAKYIISLIIGFAVILIIALVQAAVMVYEGAFHINKLLELLLTLCLFSFLPTLLILPCIYRFGEQKGRIAYYVILGIFFALFWGYTALGGKEFILRLHPVPGAALFLLLVCAYAGSWFLSVYIYKKREIS